MDKMSLKALGQCKSWLKHVQEIDKEWEDYLISEIDRIKRGDAPVAEEPCVGCGKKQAKFKKKLQEKKEEVEQPIEAKPIEE